MPLTIWTLGHSTRSSDDLLDLLRAHRIELVADVRRFPGSRRLPHFSGAALGESLAAHGIGYQWFAALGGRRRPDPDSPNIAWRNASFRAYADHLETEEFAEGLFELLMVSHGLRTAVMCAEVLWWRCHRRLVADVLTSLGVVVMHLRDLEAPEPHRLTPPARLVGTRLTYDAEPGAAAVAGADA